MKASPARSTVQHAVARRRLSSEVIGHAATLALYDELALSPKPGLVTLVSQGSHDDMDAHTFVRSLFALRGYFVRIATLGAQGALFDSLERCGIAAEARMLAATGGVNTHRGAIFMLGLLCAAAGAVAASGLAPEPIQIRRALLAAWGEALSNRAQRTSLLPGGLAAARFGLRSASAEAALGFPTLFERAIPPLRAALSEGMPPQVARLDTLFRVMGELDDSNLAHRGGMDGLRYAQRRARDFLAAGGTSRPGGVAAAAAIGDAFVRRRLSPGGSADTLAGACWMERIREWATAA